jgi:uncharacterized protein YigE (DUF2233 family)
MIECLRNAFLVPKLHLGTSPDLREISFRAEIRNEVASVSAFPSATWERGNRWILFALFWCGLTALAARADNAAPALQTVAFRGQSYLVRSVDPQKEDLRLFWKDDQGQLLRDFTALDKFVASKGERVVFAANAGMFEPDSRPVGLLVQDGNEVARLNLNDGTGNFYMKPNGVFVIDEKHEALIVESGAYPALLTPPIWATQSGPLLVVGGNICPDFNADSKNLAVRSGVGVRKDGTLVFSISRLPVNFYTFASFFLDQLKCPNALYLDSTISAFHVPGAKDTVPHTFGPMFGVVEKK